MVFVTNRVSKIPQPRGGYLKKKYFEIFAFDDKSELNSNVDIHQNLVGMAVN